MDEDPVDAPRDVGDLGPRQVSPLGQKLFIKAEQIGELPVRQVELVVIVLQEHHPEKGEAKVEGRNVRKVTRATKAMSDLADWKGHVARRGSGVRKVHKVPKGRRAQKGVEQTPLS